MGLHRASEIVIRGEGSYNKVKCRVLYMGLMSTNTIVIKVKTNRNNLLLDVSPWV